MTEQIYGNHVTITGKVELINPTVDDLINEAILNHLYKTQAAIINNSDDMPCIHELWATCEKIKDVEEGRNTLEIEEEQ